MIFNPDSAAMTNDARPSDRAARIARVLRPLGSKAMSMAQAQVAGKLLGLHWTTVYRLRKRFIEDPVATSVAPRAPGPSSGFRRLDPGVEQVIAQTLAKWLPRQRHLAHPQLDLTLEIRARCERANLKLPSRSTVVRRWELHREEEAARWSMSTTLAGVLPHEGMLPVGQLSFPLFFAWLGGFKSEAQHPNFSESSLMNANC